MSEQKTWLSTDPMRGRTLEYQTLRTEIIKRIELRQQIVAITLTMAGIFLSVGLSFDTVVLIYPILALFLAFGWAQNDLRIASTAKYIREKIEPKVPGLNFETSNQQRREEEKDGSTLRMITFSHGGVFVVTQLLAIGLGLATFTPGTVTKVLLVADSISVVLVIWLLARTRRG